MNVSVEHETLAESVAQRKIDTFVSIGNGFKKSRQKEKEMKEQKKKVI